LVPHPLWGTGFRTLFEAVVPHPLRGTKIM